MAEVGCAGILVADMLCGPMNALPKPGELLTVEDIPAKAGGCAANVAIGLARQNITASVVGCVGKDIAAEIPLTALREHGVDCSKVARVDATPTSKTAILLVSGEDRRYIHSFGANSALTVHHIERDWLAGLRVFYLGGLFVLPGLATDELVDLLAFCRRSGIVSVVTVAVPEPFGRRDDLAKLLPMIDYFLPNDHEARLFTGRDDPVEQAAALVDSGAGTAIVTCGGRGAVVARDGKRWRCGAFDMPIVDPSGCGDAFAAGVITGIVRGWDIPRLLGYASALGASAVRAVGTTDGVFRAEEAKAFVAKNALAMEEWFAD
ncbi:MAG TPA: carbohydrate kinase family protein [Roseiarcus sp.]|nr:carbohydrate kinase family protein [Roseiarcus sp.]